MEYRVRLTPRAARDIDRIYRRIVQEAQISGQSWYNRLYQAIQSLKIFPERGKVTNDIAVGKRLVRKLLHGRKPHVYRIYFEIVDDVVQVVHIRHGRHGARSLPNKSRKPYKM